MNGTSTDTHGGRASHWQSEIMRPSVGAMITQPCQRAGSALDGRRVLELFAGVFVGRHRLLINPVALRIIAIEGVGCSDANPNR
jgi:hypothetical protein